MVDGASKTLPFLYLFFTKKRFCEGDVLGIASLRIEHKETEPMAEVGRRYGSSFAPFCTFLHHVFARAPGNWRVAGGEGCEIGAEAAIAMFGHTRGGQPVS